MIIEKIVLLNENKMFSFNITVETKAPVAALIIIGIKAVILISAKPLQWQTKLQQSGALKAAPIPAATPQANKSVLSL